VHPNALLAIGGFQCILGANGGPFTYNWRSKEEDVRGMETNPSMTPNQTDALDIGSRALEDRWVRWRVGSDSSWSIRA
jgi:hypothetical protein